MNIDEAVSVLSGSPDHRLLRRVPPVAEWKLAEPTGPVGRAVVIDAETTGLEDDAEIIELAIVPFDYDKATGRVVRVDMANALSAFRQPSVPISEEAKSLTGITDEMVAGQAITSDRIAQSLYGAQVAITHHCGFDRVKLEKHWPELFEPMCFACSYAEIDWRGEGVGSSKLDYIAMKFGVFHEGHRALDDVLALLYILAGNLPTSGRSVLGALLDQSRKPLYEIRAEHTLIGEKDLLRSRGYKWDPNGSPKAWVLSTGDVDGELSWLKASPAYTKVSNAAVRSVGPRLRYSTRSA